MKLTIDSNFDSRPSDEFEECLAQLETAFIYNIDSILPDYSGPKQLTCELSLVSSKVIQELNLQYRNRDKVTDVLSFPVHENLRFDEVNDTGILHLGDIVISVGVMKKQANQQKISDVQEFVHLFFHGILHLCGYDHELSESEEIVMQGLEDKLVKYVYLAKGWEK